MNRSTVVLKTALMLLLISISQAALAWGWGWGFGPGVQVLPVVGETRGEVYWMAYPVGEGPCAAYAPVPDPLPPVEMPPTMANVQSLSTTTGVIKRIGKVIVETAHCAEGSATLDGTILIHAVGGTIEGIYESDTVLVMPPPETPLSLPALGSVMVLEGVYEITGGTGRYENVSGRLPFQVFVNVGEWGYADDMTWKLRMAISGHLLFPE